MSWSLRSFFKTFRKRGLLVVLIVEEKRNGNKCPRLQRGLGGQLRYTPHAVCLPSGTMRTDRALSNPCAEIQTNRQAQVSYLQEIFSRKILRFYIMKMFGRNHPLFHILPKSATQPSSPCLVSQACLFSNFFFQNNLSQKSHLCTENSHFWSISKP